MAEPNDSMGLLHARVCKRISLSGMATLKQLYPHCRSLGDMTQEKLEEIFAQYAQTIEAFQPLEMDDDDDDDDAALEAEMWVDEPDGLDTEQPDASASSSSEPSIFSQLQATMSVDTILRPDTSIVEKPLPKQPTEDKSQPSNQGRRKSQTASLRSKNRLSWTSDTGVLPSSSIVQNMASELMNLFDMEFSVDIKLNTAPKLPELPFKNCGNTDARTSKRYSVGSLMNLIHTFETFTVDEDPFNEYAQNRNRTLQLAPRFMTFPPPPSNPPPSERRNSKRRSMSFPPPTGNQTTTSSSTSGYVPPQRSSSLKYRHLHPAAAATDDSKQTIKSKSTEFLASLAHAMGASSKNENPVSERANLLRNRSDPGLSKKKSIIRLASLVRGKQKKQQQQDSNQPAQSPTGSETTEPFLTTPRKSISSIVSTSSGWSSTSEVLVAQRTVHAIDLNKPLPSLQDLSEDRTLKRRSYTVARPIIVKAQDLRRARSLGHRYPANRNKRRSSLLMEKTASKRRSLQQQRQSTNDDAKQQRQGGANLSRSKSAFIKIGNGLKSRRRTLKRKSMDLRSCQLEQDGFNNTLAQAIDQVDGEQQQQQEQQTSTTFVRRMATLGRRMRLQRV